jgi:hypothetical protein
VILRFPIEIIGGGGRVLGVPDGAEVLENHDDAVVTGLGRRSQWP